MDVCIDFSVRIWAATSLETRHTYILYMLPIWTWKHQHAAQDHTYIHTCIPYHTNMYLGLVCLSVFADLELRLEEERQPLLPPHRCTHTYIQTIHIHIYIKIGYSSPSPVAMDGWPTYPTCGGQVVRVAVDDGGSVDRPGPPSIP